MVAHISKIRILPDQVASQIAAGEIVQRPASAVKELLENALDAGATVITLAVHEGGKSVVQVIDNGCGMHEVDARLCFERHATSKIENAEDLHKVSTYGFRGEAMGSIAAVAEVELITRMANQPLGTRVVVEESVVKKQEPVVATVGTQVTISHLFRKMPGRRNFLKSQAIEMKHIIDEFQRVVLARPDITFFLYQNDKEIYRLPATTLSHRILHLFGDHYKKKLIACEEKTSTLSLHGYIAPPREAKKTRGEQFFFVNNRYIKNSWLHHALKKAFDNLLPEGTTPFYVLYITIDPKDVDVNVHPTKTEVRFSDERLLYSLITSSVRKSLATHYCMHTIDFTTSSTAALFPVPPAPDATALPAETYPAPPMLPPASAPLPREHAVNPGQAGTETLAMFPSPAEKEYVSSISGKEESLWQESSPMKLQLHRKYILAQVTSGLLVVDQKAAYERILYERYQQQIARQSTGAQKLLFPYTLVLQPGDLVLVQGCREELHALGFQFDILPDNTLRITAQPQHLGDHVPIEGLLADLLEQYKNDLPAETVLSREHWARALAKRATFPMYHTLSLEEMNTIVDQLFACENPNYTPDGAPVWRIMRMESLEALLQASA